MRRLILICVGMMVSICVDAELSIVHYERAYAFIYQRLYHIKDVPFKDIVFAIDYVGDTHGSKNSGIGWYVFVDLGQTIDYMKHFHPTNPEVSPHDKKMLQIHIEIS